MDHLLNKHESSASSDYLKFNFNSENSPDCIMTLRSAGSMGRNTDKISSERITILNKLDIKNVLTLNQVHSRIVYNSNELATEKKYEGDGLFTFNKNDVLAVTVADCMPVFFYSRSLNVFGVLHSGWKGTGITIEALEKIKKTAGRESDDFEFILGPSIGNCCYEVDSERGELFKNLYGKETVASRNNHDFIDLRKANVNLLEKNGIKNITVIENCTCCNDNFYSFRGDGPKEFRLMLALIGYFR